MDSYAVEANAVGTWLQIGYTAPGASKTGSSGSTANFKYSPADAEAGEAWEAEALNALNDCVKGSTWTVTPFRNSSTGIMTYNAALSNDTECSTLTPNFKNFKTSTTAGS